MRESRKQPYPGIQIGISFLLVVFVILCLVVFATLSLSGALRDNEYSRKAARRTTDYYNACSQAQEKLGEIDLIFQDAGTNTQNQEDYLAYTAAQLSGHPELTLNTDTVPATISFEEEINKNQALEVTIELTKKQNSTDERRYKIIKWKEVSSKNWEEKTTLPVIGSSHKQTD